MDISFRKLSENVGAEVQGFDVADMDRCETREALRAAFAEYKLLNFNLPEFSADDQIRFGRIFGEISTRGAYSEGGEELTEYVSNTRADGTLGNGPFHFHHDHLFHEQPLSALALFGMQIPESGSVTKFRNGRAFYERLPDEIKAEIEGIEVLHMLDFQTDEDGTTARFVDDDSGGTDALSCWRPLVWTNSKTGERQILLSPAVEQFKGIGTEEGFELLRRLLRIGRHEDDLETTYLHEWKVGDLIIWDNVALAHARAPFDSNEARTLRRTAIL